jgi:hypothetical protein
MLLSTEDRKMTAKDTSRPEPATEPKRTPLEHFVDGFPIDLAKRAVAANYGELFLGGDISAYVNVRAAEYLRTAVLPVRQPMMPLGQRPMPGIGLIEAETEHFGRLSLDAFLARSDSYAQAYLVVHKGDIVYEKISAYEARGQSPLDVQCQTYRVVDHRYAYQRGQDR